MWQGDRKEYCSLLYQWHNDLLGVVGKIQAVLSMDYLETVDYRKN
jgi:hypothetical protein